MYVIQQVLMTYKFGNISQKSVVHTVYIKCVVCIHSGSLCVHNLILNGVCGPLLNVITLCAPEFIPEQCCQLAQFYADIWFCMVHLHMSLITSILHTYIFLFESMFGVLVVTGEGRVLPFMKIIHWLGNSLIFYVIDCIQYLCSNRG